MNHKIFTVHDKAAGAYLPPFILHAEGIAIRTFTDCVNDPTHAFCKHPGDYTLMVIGEFDDNKGVITTYQTQKPLGNGLAFVVKSNDSAQLDLVEKIEEQSA